MAEINVLIADDHQLITDGVAVLLRSISTSYKASKAATLSETMRMLQAQQFTHLIADYYFPDGNLSEILPNIKALYPTLKIMVYSGYSAPIYKDISLEQAPQLLSVQGLLF